MYRISALTTAGVVPDLVVLCHAYIWSESEEGSVVLAQVARLGITLSFDLIGLYTVSDEMAVNPCLSAIDLNAEPPRDSSIARRITRLISAGFVNQILISSGVKNNASSYRDTAVEATGTSCITSGRD